MDKTIRKNEICVIGLPRCDFVFSSTRSCFIAYGFEESSLEMSIIKRVLEERGIQPVEAGGSRAPGQNAFCAKICSKIITAQFCVVLANNEIAKDGREIPNGNVHMEYGLMLGFNKYVIPFQRTSQTLPFNLAGLDTIKYDTKEFERLAIDVVEQAIKATVQEDLSPIVPDQVLQVFLLTQNALFANINTDGDRNLYQMGSPLGFALLHDFSGMQYRYFGIFTALRTEIVLWRLKMLDMIIKDRMSSLPQRKQSGMITDLQLKLSESLVSTMEIWVLVNSTLEKQELEKLLEKSPLHFNTRLFSQEDVKAELEKLA